MSDLWADLDAESRKPGPTMTITKAQYAALRAAPPSDPAAKDCGAYHPDHPGTRCRQPEGHSGEHATARLDVTWDNAYLSTPDDGETPVRMIPEAE